MPAPAGSLEVTTLMPSAFTIPAALPRGVFVALFDPAAVLGVLGAVVAAASFGLCLALARERAPRPRALRSVRSPASRAALAA
jgi:hypothetical protein